jgi:hypothetical protein
MEPHFGHVTPSKRKRIIQVAVMGGNEAGSRLKYGAIFKYGVILVKGNV